MNLDTAPDTAPAIPESSAEDLSDEDDEDDEDDEEDDEDEDDAAAEAEAGGRPRV